MMPALLPLLSKIIPLGDGSFVLRPELVEQNEEQWIGLQAAGRVLNVSTRTVNRWLGVYLVSRRPGKSKHLVNLASALRLRRATSDPRFWDTPSLQAPLKESVKRHQDKIRA
jgi:hypothetical protein